jgi:hypothetical protein
MRGRNLLLLSESKTQANADAAKPTKKEMQTKRNKSRADGEVRRGITHDRTDPFEGKWGGAEVRKRDKRERQ